MIKQTFRPLIIGSPSGCGKGTVITQLIKEFPHIFEKNISYTTRKPRVGEKNGVDRFFVSVPEFEKEISENNFIEFASFADNYYGTNKQFIKKVIEGGKICLIEIEIEGWRSISKSDLKCNYVYILPPSLEELKRRLMGRGSETEESLKKRLEIAKTEINFAKSCPDLFPKILVNDKYTDFYHELIGCLKELYPDVSFN